MMYNTNISQVPGIVLCETGFTCAQGNNTTYCKTVKSKSQGTGSEMERFDQLLSGQETDQQTYCLSGLKGTGQGFIRKLMQAFKLVTDAFKLVLSFFITTIVHSKIKIKKSKFLLTVQFRILLSLQSLIHCSAYFCLIKGLGSHYVFSQQQPCQFQRPKRFRYKRDAVILYWQLTGRCFMSGCKENQSRRLAKMAALGIQNSNSCMYGDVCSVFFLFLAKSKESCTFFSTTSHVSDIEINYFLFIKTRLQIVYIPYFQTLYVRNVISLTFLNYN